MTYALTLPHVELDPDTSLWVARPQPGRVLVDAESRLRLLYATEAAAWAGLEELGYTRRAEHVG